MAASSGPCDGRDAIHQVNASCPRSCPGSPAGFAGPICACRTTATSGRAVDAIRSIEMVEAGAGGLLAQLLWSAGAACSSPAGVPARKASSSMMVPASSATCRARTSSNSTLPRRLPAQPRRASRRPAQQAGLRVVEGCLRPRPHAETLRRWHRQFTERRAQVLAQGFDAAFLRTWLHLAYARRPSTAATSTWCSTPWRKK